MSPTPLSEERLAQLIRAEAESYRPAADGATGIAARVATRRRARVRRRAVASLLAAAVVVGIAVPVADHLAGGPPKHQVVRVVPPSGTARPSHTRAAPAFAPSNQLVTIDSAKLQILSAGEGKVVRTLSLMPGLPQPPSSEASVDPSGHTAYVSVPTDVSCSSQEVVAIDLRSGQDRVVATAAYDPVVSPDGTRLAYVTDLGASCGNGSDVTVETLRTGSRQSWVVAPPATAPGQSSETLTSLHGHQPAAAW